MVKYEWYLGEVPAGIKVKQVYGIIFNDFGKIFLRIDEGKYKLTGGKPEIDDKSFEDTLRREFLEEVNLELKCIDYLGYLLVRENDEVYAQVRMIGLVEKIGVVRPDLDNGKIYGREFVKALEVNDYLKYEDLAGKKMLNDAIKLAEEKYFIESKKWDWRKVCRKNS